MGRADVLFRFLQLTGMDRPKDINTYLSQLDVKNENRPIADQLIDLIIAGDQQLYEKYEQARREVGSRNPYEAEDQQAEQQAYERAIGYFLLKWIAFEIAIRGLAKATLGNDKAPLNILVRSLSVFSGNDLQSIEYVRQLRNDLVHGVRTPKEEYIIEAGQLIERLLADIKDQLPEDVQVVVTAMLERASLPQTQTSITTYTP